MPDTFHPLASWENLRRRAELLRQARRFFDEQEFLEVETPLLAGETVIDRHLDPFEVGGRGSGMKSGRLWLQTSPEFHMKRLLAAGAEAIYQVTRAFRRGERGPLHQPEFTMIEWYRAGDSMDAGMQLLSDLAETLLGRGPAELLTYGEAFEAHLGLDSHTAEIQELTALAASHGIRAPASLSAEDRDGWLDLLLVERIQPRLGRNRPTILYHYPASQAALARVREDTTPVAERFELYAEGIELANGYHELLDPAELRRRNAEANRGRRADGKQALPEDSLLLTAMEAGLPPSTGVALGFDRTVMVALGAKSLDEVMAFRE